MSLKPCRCTALEVIQLHKFYRDFCGFFIVVLISKYDLAGEFWLLRSYNFRYSGILRDAIHVRTIS